VLCSLYLCGVNGYIVFAGTHKVDVTYEGLNVPRSPFSVNVVPGCDPSRVRAYGPGILRWLDCQFLLELFKGIVNVTNVLT